MTKKVENIQLIEREMDPDEFTAMKAGFDEHTLQNGVIIPEGIRFGFVALLDTQFIGCSSGLAYKHGDHFSPWFYLTDLFVVDDFRGVGIGSRLLDQLEQRIRKLKIKHIWTWTAGYEAPGFYLKKGYQIFTQMEDWYSDGSSRVGVKKNIELEAQ